MNRPLPPPEILNSIEPIYQSSGEVSNWIYEQIIKETGFIYNPDHSHLSQAFIGVLWTNESNTRNQKQIVATAEIFFADGSKWSKGRQVYQIMQWFGAMPDFIITVDANYANGIDDLTWCALIEHELYHCVQKIDSEGYPKYNKDGSPKYAIRGHDVEEFTQVVARYGLGAVSPEVSAMVVAAQREPLVGQAQIALGCGVCLRA